MAKQTASVKAEGKQGGRFFCFPGYFLYNSYLFIPVYHGIDLWYTNMAQYALLLSTMVAVYGVHNNYYTLLADSYCLW